MMNQEIAESLVKWQALSNMLIRDMAFMREKYDVRS
jgi:hypothetical protein